METEGTYHIARASILFNSFIQHLIEEAVTAVLHLKQSHVEHLFDGVQTEATPLTERLKPKPIKPRKDDGSCSGITELDPVSFLF